MDKLVYIYILYDSNLQIFQICQISTEMSLPTSSTGYDPFDYVPLSPMLDQPPASLKRHSSSGHRRRGSRVLATAPVQTTNIEKEDTPLLQDTAKAATFVIASQFFSKMLTFMLNQILLRFVGPKVFGINSLFELIVSTVLLFSRESERLASQRVQISHKPDEYRYEGGVVEGTVSGTAQSVINFGYLPVLIGTPLSVVVVMWYYYRTGTELRYFTDFTLALFIIWLSMVLELLTEPLFALLQYEMKVTSKAKFESIAITARCIVTFIITLLYVWCEWGVSVLAYAIGQFTYSLILAILYLLSAYKMPEKTQFSLLPKFIWKDSNVLEKFILDPKIFDHWKKVWIQLTFKHLLTEGDRFLIGYFSSLTDQGIYALVVNYGSLVARLIFQPIEDSLRVLFTKLLNVSHSSSSLDEKEIEQKISNSNMNTVINVLTKLLRSYFYLSFYAITFGPTVAPFLFKQIVSSNWANSSAPNVLGTYTLYIPFLGLNGALEAFVQSVATGNDLINQSIAMTWFSLIFISSTFIFIKWLKLGAKSFVYANMINMTFRIIWSFNFIKQYFQKNNSNIDLILNNSLPNWSIILSFILISLFQFFYIGKVLKWSELLIPIILILLTLLIILYE